jgi:putative ATPase
MRSNTAQQDALRPHVESGLITLLGATTENPSFEVNSALLSRCRVVVLHPLGEDALATVLDRALSDGERGLGGVPLTLDAEVRAALVGGADGDARRLLNALEVAADLPGHVVMAEHVREALQAAALRYDRAGEEHYNLISALHKSVRASDAQAAVYWTVRMIEGGEDPLYIARRLVRMAVEDIGLADPQALVQTVAVQQAVHFVGLPEAGAALVQAAVYLALAPKSNRVYLAEREAAETIARTGSLPVPLEFRNAVTGLMKHLGYGEGYRYDHDAPDAYTGQEALPEALRGTVFYRPTDRGAERELSERLRRRGTRGKQ